MRTRCRGPPRAGLRPNPKPPARPQILSAEDVVVSSAEGAASVVDAIGRMAGCELATNDVAAVTEGLENELKGVAQDLDSVSTAVLSNTQAVQANTGDITAAKDDIKGLKDENTKLKAQVPPPTHHPCPRAPSILPSRARCQLGCCRHLPTNAICGRPYMCGLCSAVGHRRAVVKRRRR